MKRKLLAFSMTLAMLLSLSVATVGAHTVTIERGTTVPSRTDWFGTQPDTGQGAIMRNKAQQGEFIFNDASKDQRSISASSNITREADLDWFGVTADTNNIYFLAKVDTYSGITNNPSIELMITIDTDQATNATTPAKTQLPLNNGAVQQTNVPNDAAWEYTVDTSFSPGPAGTPYVGGSTKIWTNNTGSQVSANCSSTTCKSQLATAGVAQGSFAEIAIPWDSLRPPGSQPGTGYKPTGASFPRFTVSVLYNTRAIPTDGYNSPIIDVLGTGPTLANIQDGTLDATSVFDVHFDTNPAPVNATYEPYAPLLISEFQPNPVGDDSPGPTNTSTDSEWIEIYNPNSFPVTLANYKIGNAAKRDTQSSQGMFQFKSSYTPSARESIGAKSTIVVAKFKSRFLAGHPGFNSNQVYDVTSDLNKYGSWSGGTTISLDNSASGSATTFEEQVVLLDAKDDLVDVVTYGNPTAPTPGNIPIFSSGVAEGVSFERCPVGLDTNGGFDRLSPATDNADFITRASSAAQTPGIACQGRPGVDMQMVKTANATNAAPGEPVEFTLTYSNIGTNNDPAGTATITDTLPAGLTFVAAVPAPTSANGKNLSWNVTAPNSGGIATTIIVTATVDAGLAENTPLINTAGITSPTEPSDATTRSNNASAATVTTIGPAKLAISFDNLAGKTPPGSTFAFQINYSNTGQDDAADTLITLNLPANVTLLSQDAPGASANFSTPISGLATPSWSVGNLVSGASGTITLQAQVSSTATDGSSLSFTAQANSASATPATVTTEPTVRTVAFNKIYMPMIVK